MKKTSKPGAKRATHATRATRSQEKQSISGQRQQREKEGAGAETGAGVSYIPVSESSDEKAPISLADWLKVECDFRNVDSNEVEACCYYEYFRESAAMREAFKEGHPMPLTGDAWDSIRLRSALTMADFPVAWNKVEVDRKKELTKVVLAWRASDTDTLKHPPLVASELPLECFYHPDVQDEQLKKWWEKAYAPASFSDAESYPVQLGHSYFFALFRLDEAYDMTAACAAFKAWFLKRYAKRKKGNSQFYGKLNQLAVMRIRKREREQWKRLKLVAKFCGYNGCVKEAAAYKERCNQGRGDQPMSDAAKVEMSSASADAREFFQRLFPREEPLSY